ncbi:MAG: HD domain-containing phosphohydrolase [Sulfuricurvum sp.]
MHYHLNFREVTYSLSEALDFVGIDDTMHGKRVAYMCAEMGKKMGWEIEQIDEIITMGMLHDCGVSSTDVHSHLVNELDWNDSHLHCVRGASLLQKVPLYQSYSPVILYHHTHWDAFDETVDPLVKEMANLIYTTDRIDALRAQYGWESHAQREQIRTTVQKYSGTMFKSDFIDLFIQLSYSDSFWYYMENESVHDYFDEWIKRGRSEETDFDMLKNLAMMYADIVDAKSPFTSEHTYGVAAVARYLAELHGIGKKRQELVELSAYFHDLGKLRVSDAILQKNAPLNASERLQMNRHGFDSSIILKKIKGFQEIAKIASMHHETLDGKGYPYHISAEEIPLEARILTISDIFQALVQNRPYRGGLSSDEAYAILHQMAQMHKIDTTILAHLEEHLEECYHKAMHPFA